MDAFNERLEERFLGGQICSLLRLYPDSVNTCDLFLAGVVLVGPDETEVVFELTYDRVDAICLANRDAGDPEWDYVLDEAERLVRRRLELEGWWLA
jgi:hypothetical protein